MTYSKNIGFEEMMKFVLAATEEEQAEMDIVVAGEDWDGYKALIERVLANELK